MPKVHADELADLTARFTILDEETKALERAQQAQLINSQKTKLDNDPVLQQQATIKRLDEKIADLRRTHDELAHENLIKKQKLEYIADQLKDLATESNRVPNPENLEIIQVIKALEKKLFRAFAKYDEEFEVTRTYEQIVRRLKEEGVGFDNELLALEISLKSKERDYEELLLMSHDANQTKELIKAELSRFEGIVSDERKQREKELAERKQMVQRKNEMKAALDAKEKQRRKEIEEKDARTATGEAGNDINIDEEHRNIEEYIRAFQQIKEATGVSDVNEVIQKFQKQEETHKHLKSMTEESQVRIEKLNKKKLELKQKVQAKRFAAVSDEGPGPTSDEQHHKEAELQWKTDRLRKRHERMSAVFVTVKAGIAHLADRLQNARLEGEEPIQLQDDTITETLGQLNRKLVKLVATMQEEQSTARKRFGGQGMKVLKQIQSEHGKKVDVDKKDPELPKENFRVKEVLNVEEPSDEEFEEDLDEDVIDRDTLKKQSSTILDKAAKKTKKRRKNKRTSDD